VLDTGAGVRRFPSTRTPSTSSDDIPVAVIDLHLAAQGRIGSTAEPEGPSTFQ